MSSANCMMDIGTLGLMQGNSDGDWYEWEAARDLVEKLWPEDEVVCPWNEEEFEEDDDEV